MYYPDDDMPVIVSLISKVICNNMNYIFPEKVKNVNSMHLNKYI